MYKKADSDILKHDNLVEEGIFRDFFLEEAKEVVAFLPVMQTALEKTAKSFQGFYSDFRVDNATIADLKKLDEYIKQTNELALVSEKINKAKIQTEKEYENLRKAKAQADKAEIETSKKKSDGIKKEKDAYGQLSAELAKLKREAKNLGSELIALDKAGKKNTSEYKALAAQYIVAKNSAAALDKQVKSLDSSVGDNQRKVGDYKQSIKDAARELGLFGGTSGRVLSILQLWIQSLKTSRAATEENTVATTAAEAATSKWGRAFSTVGKAVKSIGLGVLIAILGSIAASFKTTEKGIVQFEAVMNSIGSVIKVFIGRLGQFGSGVLQIIPALFKDISNAVKNATNDIKEFFGATEQADLPTNNFAEAAKKMTTAFDGMGKAIEEVIGLEKELVTLRRQNRKDNLEDIAIIRVYASEVEKLNQIADDQTLSFSKREAAAGKALEFLKKSADAEVRIKERAVKVAEKDLEVRKLQSEDTLEAQEHLAEALDQLDDAQTKRDLKYLQGEQRSRTILIKKMQNEIQLLEQTFDKEKELRDKEIADQEKSFAQREHLSDELNALSKEKYENEVSKISEASGKIIDANELMQISDEELLAAKIKSFELGDKAEDFLLKSITNRKAEIKGIIDQNKTINKDINADLKKQQDVRHQLSNEQLRTAEINLNHELKLAEKNLAKQKEILKKQSENKKQKLIEDAAFEKKKVDDEIASAELKAKKKILIEEKLKNDLLQNANDLADGLSAVDKKQAEADQKAAELRKKIFDDVTEGIQQGLQQRSDLQQEADQRDIDFHTRMMEIQAQQAAAGRDNVLAEEQAAATQAEEKKIQDQKRALEEQKTITIIKTFLDTFNAAMEKMAAQQKANPTNEGGTNLTFFQAIGEAAAATGAVSAAIAKLFSGTGSYYEGTDSLSSTGNIQIGTGKDNLLIRAHEGERIFGVEDSAKVEGRTNKEIINNALMFENLYVPQFKASHTTTTQAIEQKHDALMTAAVTKEIRELRNEIANKPVIDVSLDKLGEWTRTIQRNGLKTIIHHKNTRSSMRRHGG